MTKLTYLRNVTVTRLCLRKTTHSIAPRDTLMRLTPVSVTHISSKCVIRACKQSSLSNKSVQAFRKKVPILIVTITTVLFYFIRLWGDTSPGLSQW